LKLKNTPNLISTGAPPQTLLGSLQRSPDPLAGFHRPLLREREVRGGHRRGKDRGEREGNGKRGKIRAYF